MAGGWYAHGTGLEEIVLEKAFSEPVLSIPAALKDGDWPLLKKDFKTPFCHRPNMPLTTLQRRWMKALLSDSRIKLFDLQVEGLEDISPLYTQEVFEYPASGFISRSLHFSDTGTASKTKRNAIHQLRCLTSC